MAGKTTPVMKQHAAAKAGYPDCVVFFRLGDFYEMFGDDALLVADVLDLTLTSRNKGKPDEVPMAGIPHHAAHGYIARLLKAGYKVAICEQMADPKTIKGIVPREVVRVITPGTWNAEGQLEARDNNWLCAIDFVKDGVSLALLDLSTAELLAAVVPNVSSALGEIARTQPVEILLGPGPFDDTLEKSLLQVSPSAQIRPGRLLSELEVKAALRGIEFSTPFAESMGALGMGAVARVVSFARECYQGQAFPIYRVAELSSQGVLALDRAAQRHLELAEATSGDQKATLLYVLDRTGSPGGARLLRRRLLAPLTDPERINARLDQVQILAEESSVRLTLRAALSRVGDLERLVVRAVQGEAHPRDLGNLRRGLRAAAEVEKALSTLEESDKQRKMGLSKGLDVASSLEDLLTRALVERPPAAAKEGEVFLPGFDRELDALAELRLSGSAGLTALETRLKEETGISNLRVRYTRVFGWYVEVSRTQASKVPSDWQRKQTVATGERFTLDRLETLAADVQTADERYRERELTLFSELIDEVRKVAESIHRLAAFLSTVDVAAALADLAVERGYSRPTVDVGNRLEIVDGRHPVVEQLAAQGGFVPNDMRLTVGEDHLWLISGPNMAGKSTFLRQAALIVVLSQMGSFVPAKSAHIGVVDRLLSRVGASDNLAGGESTFMVEMRETAHILRTATQRSFVILDEVGRGTSTFDGLAIAWAVAEYIDEVVKCRALFATHYHELTEFAERSETASNHSVSAKEHQGDVVFLHRVVSGAASRSYGVFVAQLAGLPESVLARARALLGALERDHTGSSQISAHTSGRAEKPKDSERESRLLQVGSMLKEIDPERLTGLEALALLHQWNKWLKEED